MTTQLFSAAIAGSLPKPAWLSETNKLWPQWKAEGAELKQAKLDAWPPELGFGDWERRDRDRILLQTGRNRRLIFLFAMKRGRWSNPAALFFCEQ